MSFLKILILGLIQGAAELLPVSSSAHVIVAEKLMGLDPSSPEMTFLLVMLHTGTMFAVIVYFWNSWMDHYFADAAKLGEAVKNIVVATAVTGVLGFGLKVLIEKVFLHGQPKAEVEDLFSNLPLIGGALLVAGVLIIFSGTSEEKWPGRGAVDLMRAVWIGLVQGFCLPLRGFSRSGGTISAGLLLGVERRQIEEFSFALAVVLTPIVVAMELWRLIKAHPEVTHGAPLVKLLEPGLLGMACSFVAGYLALKLLSRLLEAGRWKYFGYYCVVAALVVFGLAFTSDSSASPMTTDSHLVTPSIPASNPAPLESIAVPHDTTDGMPRTNLPPGSATPIMPVNTNDLQNPAINQPVFNLQQSSTNAIPITNAESAPIPPGTVGQ
jgi:undecaprenyl-diphosphatase